jgi:DNA-binding transcriptional MerR regulator
VPVREDGYLQIGEVAERTGVTQRTLRFYEEKGLLTPPSRMDGGFRLYSEEDVRRVDHIRRLQSLLGLSLAEIKELVDAEEFREQVRAGYSRDADEALRKSQILAVAAATRKQRDIIVQKIAALEQLRDDLETRLGRYDTWVANLDVQIAAREHTEPEAIAS